LSHALLRRIAVGSGALTIALTTALSGVALADQAPAGSAATAQQQADQPKADIGVSIKFDKSAYNSGDQVTGSITITNRGAALVPAVRLVASPTNLKWQIKDAESIWLNGPGVPIAPGANEVRTFTGTILDPTKPIAAVAIVRLYEPDDLTFRDDTTATVTPDKGAVDGNLYFDANGNGHYDQGEGLAGVKITISDGTPSHAKPTQTTDKDGHFAFTGLATGTYVASYEGLNGFVTDGANWTVDDQGKPLFVQARHPNTDTLKATVALGATTYAPGDTAKITVKLTNSGDQPLSGITESCNAFGHPNQLNGVGDGWGDLRQGKAGVTVAAHSTLTVDVTEQVPAEAGDWGFTGLECAFGNSYGTVFTNFAIASVPGAVIPTAVLNLVYDKNKDGHRAPVAGVKVYLTDDVTKKVVADAVTDSAGNATFASLPASLYEIGLVGPWQVAADQGQGTTWTSISAKQGPTTVLVEPGPDQSDPTATPPTTPTTEAPVSPAAQASPALAYTGVADVATLTVVALGILLAGIGLVVLSRRRRTS
jgi:hypothetical protein